MQQTQYPYGHPASHAPAHPGSNQAGPGSFAGPSTPCNHPGTQASARQPIRPATRNCAADVPRHHMQEPQGPAVGMQAHMQPQAPNQAYGYYYGPDGAYVPVSADEPPGYYDEGLRSWVAFSNSCYLKGFLLGAGATLILTNSTVQRVLVRSAVKVWSLFQGGVEEVKEQFRDVQAEMSQEKR